MSSPNGPAHGITHPMRFNGKRSVALLLSCLMLASMLLVGLHYHADGQEHPDCQICAVAHHQPAAAPPAIPSCQFKQPVSQPIKFPELVLNAVSVCLSIPHSRAPPA